VRASTLDRDFVAYVFLVFVDEVPTNLGAVHLLSKEGMGEDEK
jgi:hypothetical protein